MVSYGSGFFAEHYKREKREKTDQWTKSRKSKTPILEATARGQLKRAACGDIFAWIGLSAD